MEKCGKKFRKYVGNDAYQKLVLSILRTQVELIRIYKLPIGTEFISFEDNKLIWDLTGKEITEIEEQDFLNRDDLDQIKNYAIEHLRRHQFLTSTEVKKFFIQHGPCSRIIIEAHDTEVQYPLRPFFTEEELREINAADEKKGFFEWLWSMLIFKN